MTVFTVVAIGIAVTGGDAAKAGALTGAATGVAAAASGSGAAVGGAVVGSGYAGAIAGASAGGTALAAVPGAAAGATAAAGVGGGTLGSTGLLTAGVSAGPVGLLLIGTRAEVGGQRATYDCWKQVLHDNSDEPSSGMLLKDLCTHPHISHVSYTAGSGSDLPDIVLENIWDEQFKIEYLVLPEAEQMFGHAKML